MNNNYKSIETTVPKIICILPLVLLSAISAWSQQNSERMILGKSKAKEFLSEVLSGTQQHNIIDNKTLILKNSTMAIAVAEQILFSIYDKNNIILQQPYEVYLIDHYWIISGTLPSNFLGGTFLIIMDGRDCKILRLTHGK